MELTFREVSANEIQAAFELEVAGFPADEAATLSTLQYRQLVAPSLFFGAFLPNTNQLLGFICALLTPEPILTHAAMTNHVPNSAFVGIHSVCVDNQFRRKGIAVALLQAYIPRLKTAGYEGVRLVSHSELIGLYEKAGFQLVGLSGVVFGPQPWYEMKIDFDITSNIAEKGEKVVVEVPVVIERNPGKPFESFKGMEELLEKDSMNAGNIYCPRGECRCLLLKAGVGKWVRGDSNDFKLPLLPQPITSPVTVPKSLGYWSIPSPLSFENIGFSRNALPPNPTTTSSTSTAPIANIKYLVCADCDHGPLGWHDTEGKDLGLEVEAENEGKGGELRKGREFLLDVGRVRYKIA